MAERAKYKKKKIKAPSEVNDLYMPCTQDFHFKNEVTNGKSRPPSCLRMKTYGKSLLGFSVSEYMILGQPNRKRACFRHHLLIKKLLFCYTGYYIYLHGNLSRV